MLDVNLLRTGDAALVRASQLRRFASVELVDEAVALDHAWRRQRFALDKDRRELNAATKRIGQLILAGEQEEAEEAKKLVAGTKKRQAAMEAEEQRARAALDARLVAIGNILHHSVSVPTGDDEANNVPLRCFGNRRMFAADKLLMNHVDLCAALDIVDCKKGAAVAGGRGYYLKEEGALLNLALVNFGIAFLRKRGYKLIQTPHMMAKDAMARCAQLSQYDEELYKLEGEGKFLVATAEQPLAAYHHGDQIRPDELPIRYVGFSTCFRKEAGSHGRDTASIFRTHEFQKIEQFCITAPGGDESSEMHEEMIRNAEDFCEELGIAGRVVNVVSGALNNSAAKKYDLEGWFPASETYRELVSCSNCTDYQARRLGITYGQRKNGERGNKYVHTLNSTLTATERTLCCILETYQEDDGVRVPEVLQPYMCGIDFIPFKKVVDGKQQAPRDKPKTSK